MSGSFLEVARVLTRIINISASKDELIRLGSVRCGVRLPLPLGDIEG